METTEPINESPPNGWTTDCKIVEVYDGDTVTVEIKRRVRVRLLGCWAPEIRTRDDQEKRQARASREHLKGLAEGMMAKLFVPAEDNEKAGDEWSLSRVLGHLWVGSKHLATAQTESGNASSRKHGKLGE